MRTTKTRKVTTHTSGRAANVVLLAGGVWTLLHGSGLLGGLSNLTFILLGLTCLISTVVGTRRNRPNPQWPWWATSGAVVLFVIGGAARVGLGTLGNLTASRSLIPDFITLPGYLIFAVSLTGLAHTGRSGDDDFDTLLDAGVASLGALTLAWVYLIEPALFHQHTPASVRLTLTAYPALSVFFVAVTTRFALRSSSTRSRAHYYLLSAMSCMLIGDFVYMLVEIGLVAIPATLIDVPYAGAFVLFSATVLHPSVAEITDQAEDRRPGSTRGRLVCLAVAFGIPSLLTVAHRISDVADRAVVATSMLGLTGMGLLRLLRALRAHTRSEARLEHQASHDALTALPNRWLVGQRLIELLHRPLGPDSVAAILFLDLDEFKMVNDTLGHSHGDELLCGVADRLRRTLTPADTVARVGGDEFIVVLGELLTVDEVMVRARRVRESFASPFRINSGDIFSSASIGVAISCGTDPDLTAEGMIRDADTAMYHAKESGRDSIVLFDPSMRERVAERLELERELHQALTRDQLHIHYQSIVDLHTGEVEGCEALLRWEHPTLGNVPPLKFIPIAEDNGQIIEIGEWVLRKALMQVSHWRRTLPRAENLTIAINVSARQLQDESILDVVRSALKDADLPAAALDLEITESLLIENPTVASATLASLRELGVKLSIDDFGTGYSSLAYLQRFPLDRVKIDRSFVEGLREGGSADESLVAAIVAMAGALHMKTIAEGVETLIQADRLRKLGCMSAQGYYFARPVGPEAFTAAMAIPAAADNEAMSARGGRGHESGPVTEQTGRVVPVGTGNGVL